MQLHEQKSTGTYTIRAYEPGQVTVNDEVITSSVIVMPNRLERDWPPQGLADLRREHLAALALLQPEIVLLGTGPQLRFPDASIVADLAERSIGLEVMDTSAACRTYNILLSEGRNVAAALLMQ